MLFVRILTKLSFGTMKVSPFPPRSDLHELDKLGMLFLFIITDASVLCMFARSREVKVPLDVSFQLL